MRVLNFAICRVNPQSIVVLDNAAVHHAGGVVVPTESTEALVQFLLPYSPDLNPIEEAFPKVKSNEHLLDIIDRIFCTACIHINNC